MACFWKGILEALSPDFKKRHAINNPSTLLQFFKRINSPDIYFRTVNGRPHPVVHHQGKPLSQNQIIENIQWVGEYETSKVTSGHLTSTCDPFLLLLSCYCDCCVEHLYNQRFKVMYTNLFNHSGLCLVFHSDKGHFWFKKRLLQAA